MSCDKICFTGETCTRDDCEVQQVLRSKWFLDSMVRYQTTITDFTCYKCGIVDQCPLAFDLYNLDGDCLGYK